MTGGMMFKAALLSALMATPALADGKTSVQAVVGMRMAYIECGLVAPNGFAVNTVYEALEYSTSNGVDAANFSEGVIRAAQLLAEQHKQEGTMGRFCANMARIYERAE